PFRRLQPLPRHRLDARAVPLLRSARDRLGRLPLPGLRPHRKRRRHRPGLRPFARPGAARGGAARDPCAAASLPPPPHRRAGPGPGTPLRPLRGVMPRAIVLLLGLLLGAPAGAAEHGYALVEVAPGVFVHPGVHEVGDAANEDAIANIGFIVGDDAVLVVDPGGSAREGEKLRAALRRVTDRPVRFVVLTHVHPDHIFGAAAFRADRPEFIGHAKLPGALAQRGDYYVRTLRRALGGAAEGSEIVPPTRLVSAEEAIELGNRRVTIRAHGPAHTDTDLSLFDARTGTLWLSDLLFVDRTPVIDGSLVGWLRELDGLKSLPAARAIPGHGPPSVAWPAALEAEARYLRTVLDEPRAAIRQGVEIGAAARQVALAERARWQLFDEYHARNVTAAYKELEWE